MGFWHLFRCRRRWRERTNLPTPLLDHANFRCRRRWRGRTNRTTTTNRTARRDQASKPPPSQAFPPASCVWYPQSTPIGGICGFPAPCCSVSFCRPPWAPLSPRVPRTPRWAVSMANRGVGIWYSIGIWMRGRMVSFAGGAGRVAACRGWCVWTRRMWSGWRRRWDWRWRISRRGSRSWRRGGRD